MLAWLLVPVLMGATHLPAAWGLAATPDPAGPDRYVVSFHHPHDLGEGDAVAGARVVAVAPALHAVIVTTDDPATFLAAILPDPRVRSVEPHDETAARIAHDPDDPLWPEQYGPRTIRADAAWDTTAGSASLRVCIVDTGVRHTHEDLHGPRWLGGLDLVHGDADPDDDHGHGTHVAGIAAATLDNGRGIAGIAQAGIISMKVLDAGGGGPWSRIALGIVACVEHGAHVITLALAGATPSALVRDAARYAEVRNVLLVAAAGNVGPCADCVQYPARYPEIVAVACTRPDDAPCPTSASGPEVEIAAPGDDILATHHAHDRAYARLDGTSMAAAHAAGAAALTWSTRPDAPAATVRDLLACTARDVADPGHDPRTGHGIVDAAGLLNSLQDMACPEP